jgi:hypothetical protein
MLDVTGADNLAKIADTAPARVLAAAGRAAGQIALGQHDAAARTIREYPVLSALLRSPNVGRSPEKGAKTLVWLATSSAVANVSGVYFFDQEQTPPSPEAQDTDTARRLWEISERQCAILRRNAEPRS